MTSPISFASVDLGYPVYEAEFDPYDRGYVVITGGGGESKSGVPNRAVRGNPHIVQSVLTESDRHLLMSLPAQSSRKLVPWICPRAKTFHPPLLA